MLQGMAKRLTGIQRYLSPSSKAITRSTPGNEENSPLLAMEAMLARQKNHASREENNKFHESRQHHCARD
jgi:hypothetical protein